MRDPMFDFESGEYLFSLSDDRAIDSDGDMFLRMSDCMAMDMETGELHMTSRWPDEREE